MEKALEQNSGLPPSILVSVQRCFDEGPLAFMMLYRQMEDCPPQYAGRPDRGETVYPADHAFIVPRQRDLYVFDGEFRLKYQSQGAGPM